MGGKSPELSVILAPLIRLSSPIRDSMAGALQAGRELIYAEFSGFLNEINPGALNCDQNGRKMESLLTAIVYGLMKIVAVRWNGCEACAERLQ